MGTSTDAVLFHGYCWTEEGDPVNWPEGEWPHIILARRGVANPWDRFPSAEIEALPYEKRYAASTRWADANEAAIDCWQANVNAVRAEFGVEAYYHCAGSCAMPYLYVIGARALAHRGYPHEVAADALTVDPAWRKRLDRWLKEFGVVAPQDAPRWWLVSYWSE